MKTLTLAFVGLIALASSPVQAQEGSASTPRTRSNNLRLASALSSALHAQDGQGGTAGAAEAAEVRPQRLTYGGSADFYFSTNLNSPFNAKNGMRAFDVEDEHGPHLGLIDLWAQYARDPIGFRLDVDFGPTARFVNAFDPSRDDLWEHLQQFYVSANLDGHKGKTYIDFGKWVTPAGAEVIEPLDNWLYSRGLLFSWAVPFYHLGARGYRYFNDTDYVMAHINRGWNAVGDPDHGPGFGFSGGKLFGKWMLVGNYLGGEEPGPSGDRFRSLFDVIATHTPGGAWSFTHNVDVGFQDGDSWYGLSSQAKYALNPRQSVSLRGEVLRDDGGLMTGAAQTLGSLTLGFSHRLNKHILARLEYRHDFAGGNKPFASDAKGSFESTQDTFQVATIIHY